MTQISVKQFIRGKLSSSDRQSYSIVAKSRNIEDSEIQDVLQAFSGSQPLATEIPNYRGAWLVSPINGEQTALARQERSLEKEYGGQYFLYEHYMVFNRRDLNRIHKIWLFTHKPIQQHVFNSFTYLENQIDIDDDFLLKVFSTTLVELFMANTDELSRFTIQYLHTLLSKHKLKIQGTAKDIHELSAALSLILPSSQSHNYKVYFGNDIPYSWSWDIAFLTNSGWRDSNSLALDDILSNKVNESYTKIIYKILSSNQNYWRDFPDFLDNIDLNAIKNQKSNLEMKLGDAIFHKIGLRLIRVDIKLQRANAEDVRLAWKELSEETEAEDIEIILPMILEDESAWDDKGFDALSKNIPRFRNAIFQSLSDLHKNKPEKFLIFVKTWLEKQPSQRELDFIGNILFDFHVQFIPILLEILENKEVLDFKLLSLLFENKSLSDKEALVIANIILRKAKTKKEITEIISVMVGNIENQFLQRTVGCLVSLAGGNESSAPRKCIAITQRDFDALSVVDRSVFWKNLLVFAVNMQLEDILALLLFEHQESYEFVSRIEINKIQDLKLWANAVRSKIVSAAYVIVLYETNNSRQAKEYLTQIIVDDAKAYKSIFSEIQKSPNPRKYTSISLRKLNELNPESRIKILIQYIKIAKFLSVDERSYFMGMLKTYSYSHSVISQLENVYLSLLNIGDNEVCQLILELQIKDAILSMNFKEFEEKMGSLAKFAPPPKSLRNRIVVDYLNALSSSSEKHEFLANLLQEPSSSLKEPKQITKAFATSLLFRDNFRELFEDINCRLIIYQWAYREYLASKKV